MPHHITAQSAPQRLMPRADALSGCVHPRPRPPWWPCRLPLRRPQPPDLSPAVRRALRAARASISAQMPAMDHSSSRGTIVSQRHCALLHKPTPSKKTLQLPARSGMRSQCKHSPDTPRQPHAWRRKGASAALGVTPFTPQRPQRAMARRRQLKLNIGLQFHERCGMSLGCSLLREVQKDSQPSLFT